jgi:hypothetical protein
MATVPNVVGEFQANAIAAIKAAQLLASSSYQFFEPSAPGLDRVISQIPAVGSSVPPGSVVPLVISAAPAGILDIKTFGNSLSSAVTLLASSGGDLWIGSVATVSANVTVPSNVQLMFGRNGQLSVSSGVTITIQGTVQAGLWKIYSGAGAVSFSGGVVSEFYPEWWGAVGDGVSDDQPAVSAAQAALITRGGGAVLFGTRTYAFGARVNPTTYTTWRGVNSGVSIIKRIKTANLLFDHQTEDGLISNVTVEDLGWDYNGSNSVSFGEMIAVRSGSDAVTGAPTTDNIVIQRNRIFDSTLPTSTENIGTGDGVTTRFTYMWNGG